jgi:hypothetical protein
MLEGFSKENADPKSMSLTSLISRPSKLTRMLSGLISACTIFNSLSASNISASVLISDFSIVILCFIA